MDNLIAVGIIIVFVLVVVGIRRKRKGKSFLPERVGGYDLPWSSNRRK